MLCSKSECYIETRVSSLAPPISLRSLHRIASYSTFAKRRVILCESLWPSNEIAIPYPIQSSKPLAACQSDKNATPSVKRRPAPARKSPKKS